MCAECQFLLPSAITMTSGRGPLEEHVHDETRVCLIALDLDVHSTTFNGVPPVFVVGGGGAAARVRARKARSHRTRW